MNGRRGSRRVKQELETQELLMGTDRSGYASHPAPDPTSSRWLRLYAERKGVRGLRDAPRTAK